MAPTMPARAFAAGALAAWVTGDEAMTAICAAALPASGALRRWQWPAPIRSGSTAGKCRSMPW